jgi:type IV secretion system protein VirB10
LATASRQRIVSKDLAIQPTLTVRPGYPVRVLVNRDIVLRPYTNK